MKHSPHTMSTHEYRDILTLILKEATSKKDCDGQPLHVHLYKVKAHANILGNDYIQNSEDDFHFDDLDC